ncbi:putative ATP-dependent protease La [Selenomonas ruminantium subsp. lactilytica TAM6421]|uniref:Lon protease n=1 Tax=Selenomonas ruminantium subsp. lactilytica (strain NBRC 103574 / TAM6421) TaxID=927704 RepID=I0GR64_SELRL|nr:endopeptidase La [Selenomonas ruminantium]BAL83251.1 putative ATP-dependent protease La [Selenomonas ruminantium subsp. lactilytica TAM6421]
MAELRTLPLLPLRGMVVFPYMMIHIDVGRDRSMAAIEEAMVENREVMLTTQTDAEAEEFTFEELYPVGVVAEIRQVIKLPGDTVRVLVEGKRRALIHEFHEQENFDAVDVEEFTDKIDTSMNMEALNRAVVHQFEEWVRLSKKIPPETLVSVAIIDDAGRLADLIASHLNLKVETRQELLAAIDVKERLEKLYGVLTREMEILQMEHKIGKQVRKQMDKIQKDYYLREQIKAIRQELGDSNKSEIDEARKKLQEGNYPEFVQKAVEKELNRLDTFSNMHAEAGVIRNYIDCLLELPWNEESEDTVDIAVAKKILDEDHYGLTKVKDRILDYLAVHKLAKDKSAPILCLVGPPGVGKTSLATSVARATGREFVRASLGGVRDEAEIRGHRRTYVGAMPGRIIDGLRKVGKKNPVFLLDEIDKLSGDYHGDPSAALLEVLDPAQNSTFSDHFVDLPFDLSKVFWIVTANNLGNIPRPLRDRMEIIQLSSYTEVEKLEIAKRYLVARQRTQNGLKAKDISFGVGVLQKIISDYTRESGVRELEREIGSVCRKAARKIVEGEEAPIKVTKKNLTDFLGKVKFQDTKANKKPQVGVVTGMAWTEVGGTILPTEVTVLKGKGKLILTGQIGDVMQESAQAGLTYVRSRSDKLKLAEDFYEKEDIHIHLPEGAIPKDGPSAGITMATAMISALTGKKVRSDVAMTGEITLRGHVLPIGGLKEKVLAAYREGMKTIVLPKDNEKDIDDIPEVVREKLEFKPVESMDEVLKIALLK